MNVINKGLAVLTPEDAIVRREIERYISALLDQHDYLPVYSPHIGDIHLFTTSGHYPHYAESMFPLIADGTVSASGQGTDVYALKPMNCPFHIQAYQSVPRSYKDLPVRYYEFGTVYRNETSGAINGMFRLRGFTQDDGHIFCTMSQVREEVNQCLRLVQKVMSKFRLDVDYRVSIRSKDSWDSSEYIGLKENWVKAEKELLTVLLPGTFTIDEGGAAFYGPKIDFVAKDKLGREWQLGTVQLDFNLPERFNLVYKSSENVSERPVMIHRALLGSIERFTAILREQGPLPVWLCKEQVRIIPVHEELLPYAKEVLHTMKLNCIRAVIDEETAPLSAKVKKCIEDKVPIRVVVGKQEAEKKQITVQDHSGKQVVNCTDWSADFSSHYD